MVTQTQSGSDPSLFDTPYGALRPASSNVPWPTTSPSAAIHSPDPTEKPASSADTRNFVSMIRQKISEYRIEYSKSGVYDYARSPSDLIGGSSQVGGHEAAVTELVQVLNTRGGLDRNDPDWNVKSLVERYNERQKEMEVSLSEAKSHSGSNPVWSATVSVKSKNIPYSVAKGLGQKISTSAEKAMSALVRRKRQGWEEL